MNAIELLQGLEARGGTAIADGDLLKLSAPPGVLSARVLDFAKKHKVELLELLDLKTHCEPAPTGKDTPCVSCGAHCGTAALCAFCG